MAIIIDEKAKAVITRRRLRGRDATVFLRVEKLPRRGPFPVSDLVVGWSHASGSVPPLMERMVGDIMVYLDQRVARYSAWHDITISAWHIGSIERLIVDPTVLLEMEKWERAHTRAVPRIE